MNLIILSCSGTKRVGGQDMKAIDRYDGPMWKTLRALLVRYPAASAAYEAGELQIYVMSAHYGFVPASINMPDYDRKMTEALIDKMSRNPAYDFQRIAPLVEGAEHVLYAGGALYRRAMLKAKDDPKITQTDGTGIGEHRAQLGAWIARHYG